MSTTVLDVAAVRARYTALDRPLAFFDGPGGTQCPDEVIEAIAGYLRESNANIGAPYETSRRTDELVALAHERAADFLGCTSGETAFGPSMTALNFLLTRTFARTLARGDEVVVTALDHDANVAPWLEIARDLGIVVRVAGLTPELEVDYEDVARLLTERTRVVAFPAAANSVGTAPDVRRLVELAHGAGALAWADAVHYAPHGPIDVAAWGVDVLVCSPYKFFGPHIGPRVREARAARVVAAVQGATGGGRAGRAPLRARDAPSTSCSAGFVAAVDYVDSLGWDAMLAHEHALGERFLAGLPERVELYGLPTMDGRVPTFCFNLPGRTPEEVATRLAERDLAVWHGNYYALETMRYLGLAGRRRARRDRPLQHRGRGRPARWLRSPTSLEAPPPRRAAVPRPGASPTRRWRAGTS